MADAQYLGAGGHQRSDAMQVDAACSTGPPTTVAYTTHDLTPYSAVSSFNYPAATDPSLLTPVSSAGSPSAQQRLKMMRSYVPSSTTGAQQPTPPTSSRVFGAYDVHNSSQSSSPMTVHPQSSEGFEISYLNASPREEMPPQTTPYYGHYGVSEPSDADSGHFSNAYEFVTSVDTDPAGFFRQQTPIPVSAGGVYPHHLSPTPPTVQTPILSEPHPSQFRPPREHAQIEDVYHRLSRTGGGPQIYSHAARVTTSPQRKQRKKRPASRPSNTSGSRASPKASSKAEGGDATSPQEQLTLDDKASEEERFLFAMRHEVQGDRGKGMWDVIIDRYQKKFQVDIAKPALQMKLSRVIRRCAIWPQSEEEMLLKAYLEDEEKRFARYCARLKELGGARVWNWSPADIEAKLVKMGLEEAVMDENNKLRKRKRSAQRRRSALVSAASAQHPGGDPMMNFTAAGLPFGHHHHAAAQYTLPAAGGLRGYDGLHNSLGLEGYSAEQESDVLDQLERKYGREEEGGEVEEREMAVEGKLEQAGFGGHGDVAALNHLGSQRVARQACDQMITSRMKGAPYSPAS